MRKNFIAGTDVYFVNAIQFAQTTFDFKTNVRQTAFGRVTELNREPYAIIFNRNLFDLAIFDQGSCGVRILNRLQCGFNIRFG